MGIHAAEVWLKLYVTNFIVILITDFFCNCPTGCNKAFSLTPGTTGYSDVQCTG